MTVEKHRCDPDDGWGRKGATLSDKSACEEFGLTREGIFRAVKAGELQCRVASMHGNPWLRLLRREVEAFVEKKHGGRSLEARRTQTELARIDRELRRLRKQVAALEARKAGLLPARHLVRAIGRRSRRHDPNAKGGSA